MLKEYSNMFMEILTSINEPYLALDIGVSIFHDTRSTIMSSILNIKMA